MRSLSLLILFIGTILFVAGITKQKMLNKKEKIVYKYLTQSLYDKQFETHNFQKSMPALFDRSDSTYRIREESVQDVPALTFKYGGSA